MSKFLEIINASTQATLADEIENKLDKDSVKDFYIAFYNQQISSPTLVNALAEFGLVTSNSTMQRWRVRENLVRALATATSNKLAIK